MGQRLFIGGLSFSTSSDRLREVFAAIGSVTQATVVTDQATGRSRGFGFVEMERLEDAQQAISQLNGQTVDGRQIKVEMAKPLERSGGGGRREGGGDRGRSRGGRF